MLAPAQESVESADLAPGGVSEDTEKWNREFLEPLRDNREFLEELARRTAKNPERAERRTQEGRDKRDRRNSLPLTRVEWLLIGVAVVLVLPINWRMKLGGAVLWFLLTLASSYD